MNEHYYSQNPHVAHDERFIEANFYGKKFQFKTDSGVFSKKRVDFGTALLIETVQFPQSTKILDLGCGYGPVGIVSASVIEKGLVHMVDINERAIELAKYNVEHNRKNINENILIEVYQSNGFQNVRRDDFDLVLLNPPIRAGKSIVYSLFEDSLFHLKEGGELWIVIQKKQGAPSAMKKLESLFSTVEEVERSKGYSIIRSTKSK
ncbi:class I SAM-dependent methyltransferase [Tepidibacillus fermentans]|uniref:16S rRNA (Guanine1207-N2)-methyltransferase n=1 Tax=Tepidibacillus fermentans TaxID=1281767 RepID=A0A4R3KEC6_9BACI|nr:class I SAM-dependent methyltransferase [Tepidibacillus fermentans]TCS81558.1 16S rRNA (guanine1207-N2)-methyltransferase [Tepidibacillus fermentans]